jgi:hypothetical protein
MKLSVNRHVQGLVQGGLWFGFSGFVSGVIIAPFYNIGGKISPTAALVFMLTASYFGGIFMIVGGIVNIRKEYLNGKIQLSPEDKARLANAKEPKNLWLVALKTASIQWPLAAALAFGLCYGITPDGLGPVTFALFTAHVCMIHGAILVRRTCAEELLKYIAHPAKEPIPVRQYIWNEHILGNGITNIIINFLFAYAVFHVGPKNPDPIIKANMVLLDLLGMGSAIGVLVALGAAAQGATDHQSGRIAGLGALKFKPGLILSNALLLLLGPITGLILLVSFTVLGLHDFTILQAMFIKGIGAGIIAAVAAGVAAVWGAARTPFKAPPDI